MSRLGQNLNLYSNSRKQTESIPTYNSVADVTLFAPECIQVLPGIYAPAIKTAASDAVLNRPISLSFAPNIRQYYSSTHVWTNYGDFTVQINSPMQFNFSCSMDITTDNSTSPGWCWVMMYLSYDGYYDREKPLAKYTSNNDGRKNVNINITTPVLSVGQHSFSLVLKNHASKGDSSAYTLHSFTESLNTSNPITSRTNVHCVRAGTMYTFLRAPNYYKL